MKNKHIIITLILVLTVYLFPRPFGTISRGMVDFERLSKVEISVIKPGLVDSKKYELSDLAFLTELTGSLKSMKLSKPVFPLGTTKDENLYWITLYDEDNKSVVFSYEKNIIRVESGDYYIWFDEFDVDLFEWLKTEA